VWLASIASEVAVTVAAAAVAGASAVDAAGADNPNSASVSVATLTIDAAEATSSICSVEPWIIMSMMFLTRELLEAEATGSVIAPPRSLQVSLTASASLPAPWASLHLLRFQRGCNA